MSADSKKPDMVNNPTTIESIPTVNTSTYLINKDYERVINPLEPPERRNFHKSIWFGKSSCTKRYTDKYSN